MTTCSNSQLLSAYHDGELSPEDRARVDAHLRNCPVCAAELEQFARLTSVFAGFEPPSLTANALRRIGDEPPIWIQRGYLRFVESLAAVAAAILVAASGWMIYQPHDNTPARDPSIAYVVVNPDQLDTSSEAPSARLIDWIGGDVQRP